MSAAIGIFYGCRGSKQKTTKEFLLANRKLSVVPVAISILVSTSTLPVELSFPLSVSVSVSLPFSLRFCLCLSLPLCVCLYLFLCLSLYLFVSVSPSLSLTSRRAHLHVVGMLRFMTNINQPSVPTPFSSVLVSISVFMALSTVFHSIYSPEKSLFSHSILLVLSLPHRSFQLYVSL